MLGHWVLLSSVARILSRISWGIGFCHLWLGSCLGYHWVLLSSVVRILSRISFVGVGALGVAVICG